MTTQELIAELAKFPPDMEVVINLDFGKWRNITKVAEAEKLRFEPDGDGGFKGQKTIKFVAIQ